MWRELEKTAIELNLDLHYFWTLTPKQFNKYIENYTEKENKRLKEIDYFNWLLGKYITFAYNDPKKYPDKPFLDNATNVNEIMTDDEMERKARLNTLRMGGRINDSR